MVRRNATSTHKNTTVQNDVSTHRAPLRRVTHRGNATNACWLSAYKLSRRPRKFPRALARAQLHKSPHPRSYSWKDPRGAPCSARVIECIPHVLAPSVIRHSTRDRVSRRRCRGDRRRESPNQSPFTISISSRIKSLDRPQCADARRALNY